MSPVHLDFWAKNASACESSSAQSLWSFCQSEGNNPYDVIRQSGSLGNVRREEELRGVMEVSTNWWSGCTLLFFYWERRRKEWKLIPEVKKRMQRCAFFLSWTHTYVTAAQTEGADGCKSCILRGGYVSVATSSGSHPSQTSSSLTSCWTRLKKKGLCVRKSLITCCHIKV